MEKLLDHEPETLLNKTFVAILFSEILTASGYTIVAPFLPAELDRQGVQQTMTGFIFGIYSVTSIFAALVLDKFIRRFGRQPTLQFGPFLEGTAFILFGLISYFDVQGTKFAAIALIARVLQGFGASCINVAAYSLITLMYKKESFRAIALLETSFGLGMVVGPFLGTVLFWIGGYQFMIFAIGILQISCSLLLVWTLPTAPVAESADHLPEPGSNSVSKWDLLTSGYILALITGFWSNFAYDSHVPVLAMRLQNGFGLSEESIGLFFMILPTTYLVSTLSVATLIPVDMYPNRALMITGLYLFFIANLCVGPSFYLGFPDSIYIMATGQLLLGLFYPLLQCYGLPELNRLTAAQNPGLNPEDLAELYDFNSGVFYSFQSAGQALGPVFGVFVTQMAGFRKCLDLVAFSSLALGLLYQVTTK